MTQYMKQKPIFNVHGNDDVAVRKIIGGNVTNLFNLNNVKYTWANKLYRVMMENFWIPEKVSLFDDKRSYTELTPAEQKAYDGILSFLVFLDSIQTNNLPNKRIHHRAGTEPNFGYSNLSGGGALPKLCLYY